MPFPPVVSLVAQTAQAASDPLSGHLVQGAVALILALQAWVIRAVTTTRDDVREIRQTVFGVNGDNGVNSAVKDQERRVARCEAYIDNTVPERVKLWDAFRHDTELALEQVREAVRLILGYEPRLVQLEKMEEERRQYARRAEDRR